jgi:FAD/FMN-containing dehydrogenase
LIAEDELEYRTADVLDLAKETGVELHDALAGVDAISVQSLLGRPSDAVYWKLQPRGRCQEIFFTTTLDRCQEFYESFKEVAGEVGFPPDQIGVYIQPIVQGTNAHCGFDLYYNHRDDSAVEKMMLLLTKGQLKLLSEGAYFSRPYGVITDAVYERATPSTVRAMRQVKSIFDPNHVLNPGTLCFKEVP